MKDKSSKTVFYIFEHVTKRSLKRLLCRSEGTITELVVRGMLVWIPSIPLIRLIQTIILNLKYIFTFYWNYSIPLSFICHLIKHFMTKDHWHNAPAAVTQRLHGRHCCIQIWSNVLLQICKAVACCIHK